MKQIQKVSSYLLFIFNVLIIAYPLFIIIQWIFIDSDIIKNLLAQGLLHHPVETPEGSIYLSAVNWTFTSKIIGFASQILCTLPLFLSFFVLKAIFRNYQKGEVFNTINANHYKYLGWLMFFDALLAKPLSETLMMLGVTFSNPAGHRYITLTFGTPNIEVLFSGILVIVISWVMVEASKLHNEQQFTI
ncbi:MAG: DUF2975 domain-containing protein [Alphaproteobacteria bacterium]|nr:DUF2975 domain-containing protein [Alphaproteobacteria bacterium]